MIYLTTIPLPPGLFREGRVQFPFSDAAMAAGEAGRPVLFHVRALESTDELSVANLALDCEGRVFIRLVERGDETEYFERAIEVLETLHALWAWGEEVREVRQRWVVATLSDAVNCPIEPTDEELTPFNAFERERIEEMLAQLERAKVSPLTLAIPSLSEVPTRLREAVKSLPTVNLRGETSPTEKPLMNHSTLRCLIGEWQERQGLAATYFLEETEEGLFEG